MVDANSNPAVDWNANHGAHREEHERKGKGEADPKSTPHVTQLGVILRRAGVKIFGLEIHPANRTITRSNLFNFQMHRASKNRAGGLFRIELPTITAWLMPGAA